MGVPESRVLFCRSLRARHCKHHGCRHQRIRFHDSKTNIPRYQYHLPLLRAQDMDRGWQHGLHSGCRRRAGAIVPERGFTGVCTVTDAAVVDALRRRTPIMLCDESFQRLAHFASMVVSHNEHVNLTSSDTTRLIFAEKHIASCLELCVAIDALKLGEGMQTRHPDRRVPLRVMDVGTGGGLPGLVMAIAHAGVCPPGGVRLAVTMVDARKKKIEFVSAAATSLGLRETEARALWGRAEEFAHNEAHRARYDVVVSRAVAELRTLVELCLPFAAPGGHLLLPKTLADGFDELGRARRALQLVGGEAIGLFDGGGTFHPLSLEGDAFAPSPTPFFGNVTLVVRKLADEPTSSKYPRLKGKPSKRPL